MSNKANMLSGWVILDKPGGISSAHAVAKVKRLLRPAKIGHAGTLDPLASGVLPLALGEATKTVPYMMDGEKAYGFTVAFGQERDTDDSEGRVVAESAERPKKEDILYILPGFVGTIRQVPPQFSAIQVAGERAYAMAREGREVALQAREVTVHALELTEYNGDSASFLCRCGKGTYIRSLARDMGRKLGCYGHISMLRRLKVGNFSEKDAISLEVLTKMVHNSDTHFLRPVESALDDILAWEVTPDQAAWLRMGRSIHLPTKISILAEDSAGELLARSEGKAVAICAVSQGSVKPVRVFNL